ncbi:MAG: glycosyltransferase family 9 protein [Deferrisomatales bacterium]|nr:glycosyltransferase family 9 protein [Deferrisomatales bacterium]
MKVLLVRFSSLGDVVLVTAAVEALREALPGVHLDILTKPEFRPVFAGNRGVSGLLEWDPVDGLGSLARAVRRGEYDWIVDLHANLRTWVLRALVPGPRWSVYAKGVLRRRLAVWLRKPGLLAGQPHVVERYLSALAPLGVGSRFRKPCLFLDRGERDAAGALLRDGGWDGRAPLIGLAPGARWATKAWPMEHWVKLARAVVAEGAGLPVLVGGTLDRGLCERVLRDAGVTGVNLAGSTSVRGTAAVLECCDALVANDSAPMHLAVAVGTRVVALFGPTMAGFGFSPLGDDDVALDTALACRPCSLHGDDRCPKGHHRCLEGLEPVVVVAALRRAPGGPRCPCCSSMPLAGRVWDPVPQ